MRIIHVVGRSNSGKTTFIRSLIPELRKIGMVSVIKHLGDHEYKLEAEKDTTFFFEADAEIVVGIDATKTIIAVHGNSLDNTLKLLAGVGMNYVIIEGFKQYPFPKIIIGNLEIENGVLRNPTVDEVISNLELFRDYQK